MLRPGPRRGGRGPHECRPRPYARTRTHARGSQTRCSPRGTDAMTSRGGGYPLARTCACAREDAAPRVWPLRPGPIPIEAAMGGGVLSVLACVRVRGRRSGAGRRRSPIRLRSSAGFRTAGSSSHTRGRTYAGPRSEARTRSSRSTRCTRSGALRAARRATAGELHGLRLAAREQTTGDLAHLHWFTYAEDPAAVPGKYEDGVLAEIARSQTFNKELE
jgi:hypothetical protein